MVITRQIYLRIAIKHLGRETLSSEFKNNKGADQPVHLRRLISTFVIISRLPEAFYRVTLLRGSGGGALPYMAEDGFCAIQMAKINP